MWTNQFEEHVDQAIGLATGVEHAQKLVLICDPKGMLWSVATVCSGTLLCDSTPGPNQGSCQTPKPLCVGKQPGDKLCDGLTSVQCGPDLVTTEETACAFACVEGICTGACKSGAKQCSGLVPQACDATGAWQDGAPCAYVCASGSCTGECTPQAKECFGKTPATCSGAGVWQSTTPCSNVCVSGACAASCTTGAKQCFGNVVQTCDGGGAWQDGQSCAFLCANGACTGNCVPGTQQCASQTPQTCDAGGNWQSGTPCTFVCNAGVCGGVCTPGSKDCQGLTPRVCDSAGQWQAGVACTYVCAAGGCSGVCTPGEKKCDGPVPQTCGTDGQWSSAAACPFVCTAGSCTGGCTPASKQCNGLAPQTCNAQGTWDSAAACPFVCAAGVCSGTCTPGAKQCVGATVQLCDANGSWQDSTTCPFACTGGACGGVCVPASKQCSGTSVQTCDAAGQWGAGVACTAGTPLCDGGQCVAAGTQGPSCSGLAATCGSSASDNCCASSLVAGGTFQRSNDPGLAATVADFRLDRYEITVGRFRKFVTAWIGGWRPAAGAGKHVHLHSGSGLASTAGGFEPGWDTAWASSLATTSGAWDANLKVNPTYETWTATQGAKENRPINYITWAEAYAFCIWDGGFLPSEAEWNYAAAGGGGADGQRLYPWSNPPSSTTIDCSYANYRNGGYCSATYTAEVGSRSPSGDAKWGHSDLAGNLKEWSLDRYVSGYATAGCSNCVDLSAVTYRVVRDGAFNTSDATLLYTHNRTGYNPVDRYYVIGARCARVP